MGIGPNNRHAKKMNPELTAYLLFAAIAAAFVWWMRVQEKHTQY